MDFDIVLELLMVSMSASIICTELIQKIKEIFNFGKLFNKVLSFIVSFSVGVLYSYSFYTNNILYSVWIGLFTFIGAENIYKAYSSKYVTKSTTK